MKLKPEIIGLVAAGLSAALFFVYTRHYEAEVSGGQGVDVLVSLGRIERGAVISDSKLSVRTIPQAYADDRQIRAKDRARVIGLRAAEPIEASQTLLWSDALTLHEDKRDLSSLVEPGHRAVTAPFSALPTYSMIRPGDFVDVIGTGSDESGEKRSAKVLLQRVLVLAIGTRVVAEKSDDRRSDGHQQPLLTLSLNLDEAEILALAAQRGGLSVALRNPSDQRVVATSPAFDVWAGENTAPRQQESVRPFIRKGEGNRPIRLEARAR
jgi:pilus assembly protein CpaB